MYVPLKKVHLYLEKSTQTAVIKKIQLDPSTKDLSSWDEAKANGEVVFGLHILWTFKSQGKQFWIYTAISLDLNKFWL